MKLQTELSKLSDEEFKALVDSETAKRAAKTVHKRKTQPARPKEISAEDFKQFVARTKTLFVGKKITKKTKLVLDVDVTEHVAWVTDLRPSLISVEAKVSSDQLDSESWILKRLGELLSDFYADLVNYPESFEQFEVEIQKLVDDIQAKEKELGLPSDTIWDAVYARCDKYSQA